MGNSSCVTLNIVDDCSFEETEQLTLTLSSESRLVHIDGDNRVATVFIEDNESKCILI